MNDELDPVLTRALQAAQARAAVAAEQVDSDRVAAAVLGRLRTVPAEAALRRWPGPRAWRVAAAIAVMAASGWVAVLTLRHDPVPTSVAVRLPTLYQTADSVLVQNADSLFAVVQQLAVVNSGLSGASAVTVDDLNEQELRALLQALETSEETL